MDSTTVNFYLTFRGMPSNMPDLALLFNPSSVAVIGESSDRNKLSGRTIHFLKTHGVDLHRELTRGDGAVILEKYGDSLSDIH